MKLEYEFLLYVGITVLLQVIIALLTLLIRKRKAKKCIKNRHVVVTGGTSGIGLNIAIECVLKGANVTVIARNLNLLEETVELLESKKLYPNQKITAKSLDISRDYLEVCNALAEIEETVGPIYMLVNCAGLAICGTIEDVPVEDAKTMMNVNYFGTYYCTRYVLPKMKAAKDGIIVLTASQAALLGIYGYGPYAASKFALRGLAETISMECRHLGVSVTLALPSDTDTPGFENEEKTKPKETKIISGSGGLANPEKVGKKIVEDALKGSFFSILGFESWLLTLLCCGIAPWGGILLNILQVLLMGPLRIIGIIIQWNFSRIIKQCAKEKKNKEIQVNLCNCNTHSLIHERNDNNNYEEVILKETNENEEELRVKGNENENENLEDCTTFELVKDEETQSICDTPKSHVSAEIICHHSLNLSILNQDVNNDDTPKIDPLSKKLINNDEEKDEDNSTYPLPEKAVSVELNSTEKLNNTEKTLLPFRLNPEMISLNFNNNKINNDGSSNDWSSIFAFCGLSKCNQNQNTPFPSMALIRQHQQEKRTKLVAKRRLQKK